MNEELTELFEFYLPDLDQAFVKAGIELSSRPLRAASFIVENCVTEVEGDSIENYHQKPWFALFFKCARQWYEDRYGGNLNSDVLNKLEAAVQIYQRWYLLEIPCWRKNIYIEKRSGAFLRSSSCLRDIQMVMPTTHLFESFAIAWYTAATTLRRPRTLRAICRWLLHHRYMGIDDYAVYLRWARKCVV